MYILGDIGNTEIKICTYSNKLKLLKKKIIQNRFLDQKKIYKELNFLLKSKNKIKKVLFCSVVPASFLNLKNFFIKKLEIRPIEVKEISLNDLINIKLNKKQVGSDRIVNAIGINDNKENYIILDFGTATTFDVIKKKNYVGGVIAPGLKLSLESLSNNASLIPKINISKVKKVIGTNTNTAVKSGFYWGYTGLIDNIVKLIIKQSRLSFRIVLTGGYSHLFKNIIRGKPKIDKDLIFKGLLKILKKKFIK